MDAITAHQMLRGTVGDSWPEVSLKGASRGLWGGWPGSRAERASREFRGEVGARDGCGARLGDGSRGNRPSLNPAGMRG